MSIKLVQIFVLFLFINNSIELGIECNFSNSYEDYYCLVEKLWDTDGSKLTQVTGTHTYGRSHKDVDTLLFKEKLDVELKSFPRDIFSFFPNIVSIKIEVDNDINQLSSDDLKQLTDLKVLWIEKSKIKSISGDLFKYNKKLRNISFESSKSLEHVGKGLLADLSDLEYVCFRNSNCIQQDAESQYEIPELTKKLLTQCPPAAESTTSATSPLIKNNVSTTFATIGIIWIFGYFVM